MILYCAYNNCTHKWKQLINIDTVGVDSLNMCHSKKNLFMSREFVCIKCEGWDTMCVKSTPSIIHIHKQHTHTNLINNVQGA